MFQESYIAWDYFFLSIESVPSVLRLIVHVFMEIWPVELRGVFWLETLYLQKYMADGPQNTCIWILNDIDILNRDLGEVWAIVVILWMFKKNCGLSFRKDTLSFRKDKRAVD